MTRPTNRRAVMVIGFAVGLAACLPSPAPSGHTPPPTPAAPKVSLPPTSTPDVSGRAHTILAAGDVASCESQGDEATADLLDELLATNGGSVIALGDLAYEDGTAEQFATCYQPTWGRHLGRTLPTPGNHEYGTAGAAGYFAYFGATITGAPDGWYAVQLGSWWVISLNSNCDEIGGCGAGSEQDRYLTGILSRIANGTEAACILAFWHHPRWSSGAEHGSDDRTDALWRALADAGADVVLTGHDHEYERFVPMDADGLPNRTGMVQFVVGTGGRSLYEFETVLPTSAVRDASTYGVLQLSLWAGSYDWAFVAAEPGGFTDAGTASCS